MVVLPFLCDHVGRAACRSNRSPESNDITAGAAAAPNLQGEDITMITAQDRENYGDELIDMSRCAAVEALSPELQRLHVENQNLRAMAARSQHAEIERALDAQVPSWRSIYSDPQFAAWLALPDPMSGGIRSALMRNAVSNGDSGRVIAFYKGFLAEAGHHAPAARQSRSSATSGKPVYTRPQIASLYERRRKGEINDAQWGPIEADIVKAACEGRIVGAVGPDGTQVSRWAR
jgi:hypothetical protein